MYAPDSKLKDAFEASGTHDYRTPSPPSFPRLVHQHRARHGGTWVAVKWEFADGAELARVRRARLEKR